MNTHSPKASIINYIEQNYQNLDALDFCQQMKIGFLNKAIKEFNHGVKSIAERSLKDKNVDKNLVKWARDVRKSVPELFASSTIYLHFYNIRRKNLLAAKRLLRMQEEENFINEQMKDNENNVQDNEESIEEEKKQESDEESQEDDKEESQEGDKEITYDSIYQDFRYDEANKRKLQDLKCKFENNFNIMRKEDKWYLSTGKCVEDELYAFGMQCVEGHPSHSFIIDISDKNYTKYNVFSNNELNEIKSYNTKERPRMDISLRKYLNSFNKTTADEIRREISKPQEFDQEYNREFDGDFDWIRHSIYTLLRLYESNKLKKPHRESCQECSSVSSSKRKNKDRLIGGIEVRERKKMGYRCDMIFCENRIGHDDSIEYGASEAGKMYDGDQGTKRLEEGSKKLPECLKDMLDYLLIKKDERTKIQTVGFIHSGLESFFMTADRPKKYITRITKSNQVHISNDISNFGATVLPAIYSAWIAKEVVKTVQAVLHECADRNDTEDSIWLDDYWDKERDKDATPETSTSNDIRNKKIKTTK
ncbi:hypothetical protein INT48_008631 [Thamnidium elegans]|uniref:Uncharacterized protein n=1 Tax=Thamnidium elegans TaxID=101142 RepID=A0A8H7VVR3_9FUNG|nr:hypothetical protein INT48_008631 [Thamnidium elegans]